MNTLFHVYLHIPDTHSPRNLSNSVYTYQEGRKARLFLVLLMRIKDNMYLRHLGIH